MRAVRTRRHRLRHGAVRPDASPEKKHKKEKVSYLERGLMSAASSARRPRSFATVRQVVAVAGAATSHR